MANYGTLTEERTGRTLDTGGIRIHYHEAGEGYPVLFLHSFNAGSTAWIHFHKNIEFLSQHFRCIAMDLVNHGRTGPLVYKEYVHELHARLALQLMDSLGIEKASIIGNSVGGSTALLYALNNPDRVEKLVVGGCHLPVAGTIPHPFGSNPSEGSRANREVLANPTRENVRRSLLVHIDDRSLVTDDLVDYFYGNLMSHPEHLEAVRSSSTLPAVPRLRELANLSQPTLIIHGRNDRMVPVDYAVLMLNHIPHSRLLVMPNCGHLPPFECPQEYNWQVLHFLTSNA